MSLVRSGHIRGECARSGPSLEEESMAELALYEVKVGKNVTTMKLTEEDAEAYGDNAKKVEAAPERKARTSSPNKARTAADK